ncbi:hypothetical protein TRAPUB_5135 [Trametes pubescens]|uniref:Uncharacterized protein n=1 Tax=Trametes pubescens TaxID=154538 RepID=A0A1M2V9I3_TRAPU|nr:hypothetical protein TRAPUB_5135 [Trametes pubescens]
MEEDDETSKSIPKWVELEYSVGHATVQFTHLSPTSCNTLASLFAQNADPSRAPAYAHQKSVLQLMEEKGVPLEKVCLLDPRAEKELSPEDGDGRFEWFLFGGILGS